MVTPDALLTVRLRSVLVLKVLAGIVWAEDPFISMVPVVAVNVPSLVMVPAICSVLPETVTDAPDWMVKFLHVPSEPDDRTGWLLVTPVAMMTSDVKEGN